MTQCGQNGMTLENWRRSLALQTTVARIGLERLRAALDAQALAEQLPELEAKAATTAEREEVADIAARLRTAVSEEVESRRLEKKSTLDLETLGDALEGKAA